MKILSIDVGIRNLSFCLFEIEDSDKTKIEIIKWDNIDLTTITENKCIEIDKKGLCDKPAKKANLITLINEFIMTNCFTVVQKSNASKVDLVTIGRNIQHKFDEILCDHLQSINKIIIENQIGPIANKMKTIQGMLSQYFIMRNNNIQIDFISASNKLKDFIPTVEEKAEKAEKMDYKQRKKLGIQTTLNIVNNDFRFKSWADFLHKHNKKDDLSDCFLQGMWYIKHKI